MNDVTSFLISEVLLNGFHKMYAKRMCLSAGIEIDFANSVFCSVFVEDVYEQI